MVWQVMQGVTVVDPASNLYAAADSGLWHWLQSVSIDGHVQQPRILRSVRRVAGHAALSPDRGMLEHERSARLGVALGADLRSDRRSISDCCARKVPCTSWQSVHFTRPSFTLWWNRHVELRLLIGVALVAELGCAAFSSFVSGIAS